MNFMLYLLTLLTGIGILVSTRRLWRALASQGWPVVEGEVVAATMEGREESDSPRRLRYRPLITYSYNFRGVELQSDNYDFQTEWLDRETTVSILSRYDVGRRIEVRVNPVNPELAVLVPGATFGHYFAFAACTGFFGAFLYVIARGI